MKLIGLICGCLLAFLTASWGQQKVHILGARTLIAAPVGTNNWRATQRAVQAYTIAAYNESGSELYLHVFDTNGVPGNGAKPMMAPVRIPALSTGGWTEAGGIPFAQGIVVCASTTDGTLTLAGQVFHPHVTVNASPF